MEKPTGSLDRQQFEQLAQVITSRTGLVFPRSREAELRQCLLESFRESSSYPSFKQYLRFLESDHFSRKDMRRLIARLTVGETYFFRNRPQFDLLRETIIPDLVQKRGRTTRSIRVWSAGCSTGEEAYSLGILLRETVPQVAKWSIHILATDISEDALAQAESGVYREWSFRDVPPLMKECYFTRLEGGYKINPEIRSMVTFRYLNLIEDAYPLASGGTNFMDLIMCRNVMIYFETSISSAITTRFFRCLNRGGYLIVGHTEPSESIYKGFARDVQRHTVVYRKMEQSTEFDRGLALRFRGSGALPANSVPLLKVGQQQREEKRPGKGPAEETAIFEEGANAYREGKFKAAASRFKEVLSINPANHRASYMMALLEADQNHLRKAEEYCLQAIRSYPLSLEAHYLLAVIAREEGDGEKEMDCLKKTLYIKPDFILGHYQVGAYHAREGNPLLAQKYLRQAFKLLEKWSETDYIEGIEGMTVGRLREVILQALGEKRGSGGRDRQA